MIDTKPADMVRWVDASGKIVHIIVDGPRNLDGSLIHPDPGLTPIHHAEFPATSGQQIWNGAGWDAPPAPRVKPLQTEELYDMLESKGVLTDLDRPRPKNVM